MPQKRGKATRRKVGRDATTGRFISVTAARRRPAHSVVETIRKPRKMRKR